MSDLCKQCGAALTERDAFCTKCGTRRGNPSETGTSRRFCTKCGEPFAAETKFCTKCGAAAGISSSSAAETARHVLKEALAGASGSATAKAVSQAAPSPAPVAKSAAEIPKGAVFGGAVIAVLVLVVVVAGVIHAAHQAKEKAAAAEASSEFEKNLADMAAKANTTGQNAKDRAPAPTPADVNKSLAEVAAAANALTQDAQKQRGVNQPNAIPGIAGAASGSTSPSSSSIPAPGSPAAIAAASAAADAALTPPAVPSGPPVVPVAATGNQAHYWALEYERTVGGSEADLVVRTGDINNLGFGWPKGFDPFSGQSTPGHPWPDINHIPPNAPPGTDRIMVGTSVMPIHLSIQHVAGKPDRIVLDSALKPLGGDGYSGSLGDCLFIRDNLATMAYLQMPSVLNKFAANCIRERQLTMPTPIVLPVGALPSKINNVVVQIFADDFQPRAIHSHFQVSLNGTRIPTFEYALNSLDQSGPVGKLLTLELLPEYWPLLKPGAVKLLIDDPTTHEPDGYAIDFVRILVNPHKFKYEVSLTATVTDADTHKPITGATVSAGLASAAADKQGKCQLQGIPAGLVVATANAPGYDENSVPVDLPA